MAVLIALLIAVLGIQLLEIYLAVKINKITDSEISDLENDLESMRNGNRMLDNRFYVIERKVMKLEDKANEQSEGDRLSGGNVDNGTEQTGE